MGEAGGKLAGGVNIGRKGFSAGRQAEGGYIGAAPVKRSGLVGGGGDIVAEGGSDGLLIAIAGANALHNRRGAGCGVCASKQFFEAGDFRFQGANIVAGLFLWRLGSSFSFAGTEDFCLGKLHGALGVIQRGFGFGLGILGLADAQNMNGGVFQPGHFVLQPLDFSRELCFPAGLLSRRVLCSAPPCANFREARLRFIGR